MYLLAILPTLAALVRFGSATPIGATTPSNLAVPIVPINDTFDAANVLFDPIKAHAVADGYPHKAHSIVFCEERRMECNPITKVNECVQDLPKWHHMRDAAWWQYRRVKADQTPDTWGYVGHCVLFEKEFCDSSGYSCPLDGAKGVVDIKQKCPGLPMKWKSVWCWYCQAGDSSCEFPYDK